MQDLPIGISEFPELRKNNCLYVDKTQHVHSLLKSNRRTFLSRPRRFGKSLLVSTLEAALQGKRELFKDLWIDQSGYDWKQYGVIRLDFSELAATNITDFKEKFAQILLRSAENNDIKLEKNTGIDTLFMQLIAKLHNVSDKAERQEEYKLLELDKLQGTEDLLQTFEIESLPLPSLLFQTGYLTIDTYNPISRNYTLKYPNLEVRASLNKHLTAVLTKNSIAKINPLMGILYQFLIEEKIEEMVDCLRTISANTPYSLHKEDEKCYHPLLQVIFFCYRSRCTSRALYKHWPHGLNPRTTTYYLYYRSESGQVP